MKPGNLFMTNQSWVRLKLSWFPHVGSKYKYNFFFSIRTLRCAAKGLRGDKKCKDASVHLHMWMPVALRGRSLWFPWQQSVIRGWGLRGWPCYVTQAKHTKNTGRGVGGESFSPPSHLLPLNNYFLLLVLKVRFISFLYLSSTSCRLPYLKTFPAVLPYIT